MTTRNQVTIYTDGSCMGNPGPGGYGVVLLHGGHRKELAAGYRATTNNRMEILAVIVGLEGLKEQCQVTLYSDSEYLVNTMTRGWALRWRANSWMRNKKDKAVNVDLWERMLQLCQFHDVEFRWVRGHAGNRENERCDQLATRAARGDQLLIDDGYEATVRR